MSIRQFDKIGKIGYCFTYKLLELEKEDEVHHTGLFTVGVFGLIFRQEDGKLLLKRRPPSISQPGNWDLPGGGISPTLSGELPGFGEDYFLAECIREVREETGLEVINLVLRSRVRIYVVLSTNEQDPRHIGDIALAIPMRIPVGASDEPQDCEFQWVSPDDLQVLAQRENGNRLVGGVGGRHWRMCVEGFREYSSNGGFRGQTSTFDLA
ncbi:MAG: NUDIX hydrolase [bacterium]|nr:NUDIX hydrolase [bacterium]